jgi:hypothetical protein
MALQASEPGPEALARPEALAPEEPGLPRPEAEALQASEPEPLAPEAPEARGASTRA